MIVRSDDTEPIPSIAELVAPAAQTDAIAADDDFIVVRTVQPVDAELVIGTESAAEIVWKPIAMESILGDTAETVDLDGAIGEAVDPFEGQWTATRTFDWSGKVVTDQLPELIEPEPEESPEEMTLNSAPGTPTPAPESEAEPTAEVETGSALTSRSRPPYRRAPQPSSRDDAGVRQRDRSGHATADHDDDSGADLLCEHRRSVARTLPLQ